MTQFSHFIPIWHLKLQSKSYNKRPNYQETNPVGCSRIVRRSEENRKKFYWDKRKMLTKQAQVSSHTERRWGSGRRILTLWWRLVEVQAGVRVTVKICSPYFGKLFHARQRILIDILILITLNHNHTKNINYFFFVFIISIMILIIIILFLNIFLSLS